MTEREEMWWEFLRRRGVEQGDECQKCVGLGVCGYSSTSTWAGGPGGQMLTSGTCDKCWGSGRASRPWLDLRRAVSAFREVEALRAQLAALRGSRGSAPGPEAPRV